MHKGFLIIAVGHRNYGQLAGTLAASIRANGCDFPIHLAYEVDTIARLDEQYLGFFTSKSIIPQECITLGDKTCYIKAKAHMNELSPFEETIFLDADLILLKGNRVNTIFDELKVVDFTIKNSGISANFETLKGDENQWAPLKEIKEKFEFTNQDVWNIHSEFIYWKKNKKNDELFTNWVENFENIRTSHIEFGGCIPDELPLWIAMCQLGIIPHQAEYKPTYWPMESKNLKRIIDLNRDGFLALSIGGNNIHEVQKNNYDILVQLYAKILNLRYKFLCQPKKKWVAERHTY